MKHVRRLDPVACQQAEKLLVARLAEIALLAGIRHCEEIAGTSPHKRFHHSPSPSALPHARRVDDRASAGSTAMRPPLPFPTDAELAASARRAIDRSGLAGADQITVTVTNGWLILEGEAGTPEQQQEIEAVARGVNGIAGVSNRIALANEVLAERVHQKIAEDLVAAARLQAFRVRVAACDRTIVLSGSARSESEREQAVAAAWKVPGTATVVNQIELCAAHVAGLADADLRR